MMVISNADLQMSNCTIFQVETKVALTWCSAAELDVLISIWPFRT